MMVSVWYALLFFMNCIGKWHHFYLSMIRRKHIWCYVKFDDLIWWCRSSVFWNPFVILKQKHAIRMVVIHKAFLLCSPKYFGGAYSRRVVCPSIRPSVSQSVRPSVRPYVPNSCQTHYFVICSWILKLFHRNDHHIETMCRAQHLGRYLEG